jgi:dimethylargininase
MRQPAPTYPQCVKREEPAAPIDLERARSQHAHYARALQELDVEIIVLDALPDFPDSVFIEDNALVVGDRAFLCRSGAASRVGEEDFLAPHLERYKRVERFAAAARIDAGDCLQTDRHLFVGQSQRTNRAAVDRLAEALPEVAVISVSMRPNGVLHLKSAASYLGRDRILVAPGEIDPSIFARYEVLRTPAGEAAAANCVRVGDAILVSAKFPHTAAMLREHGLVVVALDISEFQKGDGSLTCLSLFL